MAKFLYFKIATRDVILKAWLHGHILLFLFCFLAMDLLNGHIAAVPATEAAVSLKL